MALTIEDLRGRAVIAADGHVVGEVATVLFGADGGGLFVDALRIKLRKEVASRIGQKHGLMHAATVDIPGNTIQSVADTVVLVIPLSEVATASMAASDEPPMDHERDHVPAPH